MLREFCKAKIHRLTVTDANLDYEGSITLDEELILAADIKPFEKVQVANVTNGNRFDTYVIVGKAGSGTCCINGAAAHLAKKGDIVLVISYAHIDEKEMQSFKPKLVFVDKHNKFISKKTVPA